MRHWSSGWALRFQRRDRFSINLCRSISKRKETIYRELQSTVDGWVHIPTEAVQFGHSQPLILGAVLQR